MLYLWHAPTAYRVKAIEYRTLTRRGNDCARESCRRARLLAGEAQSACLGQTESGTCLQAVRPLARQTPARGWESPRRPTLVLRRRGAKSCILSSGLKRKDYYFYFCPRVCGGLRRLPSGEIVAQLGDAL